MESTTGAGKRKVCGDGDGWSAAGGYMNAKIQKLQQQFAATKANQLAGTTIFKGICIWVNGYTNPSANDLRDLMAKHGGSYLQYYDKRQVTHIIANNLPDSKVRGFKTLKNLRIVKPKWLMDSIAAKKLLPYAAYQLYDKPAGQQEIRFMPANQSDPIPTSTDMIGGATDWEPVFAKGVKKTIKVAPPPVNSSSATAPASRTLSGILKKTSSTVEGSTNAITPATVAANRTAVGGATSDSSDSSKTSAGQQRKIFTGQSYQRSSLSLKKRGVGVKREFRRKVTFRPTKKEEEKTKEAEAEEKSKAEEEAKESASAEKAERAKKRASAKEAKQKNGEKAESRPLSPLREGPEVMDDSDVDLDTCDIGLLLRQVGISPPENKPKRPNGTGSADEAPPPHMTKIKKSEKKVSFKKRRSGRYGRVVDDSQYMVNRDNRSDDEDDYEPPVNSDSESDQETIPQSPDRTEPEEISKEKRDIDFEAEDADVSNVDSQTDLFEDSSGTELFSPERNIKNPSTESSIKSSSSSDEKEEEIETDKKGEKVGEKGEEENKVKEGEEEEGVEKVGIESESLAEVTEENDKEVEERKMDEEKGEVKEEEESKVEEVTTKEEEEGKSGEEGEEVSGPDDSKNICSEDIVTSDQDADGDVSVRGKVIKNDSSYLEKVKESVSDSEELGEANEPVAEHDEPTLEEKPHNQAEEETCEISAERAEETHGVDETCNNSQSVSPLEDSSNVNSETNCEAAAAAAAAMSSEGELMDSSPSVFISQNSAEDGEDSGKAGLVYEITLVNNAGATAIDLSQFIPADKLDPSSVVSMPDMDQDGGSGMESIREKMLAAGECVKPVSEEASDALLLAEEESQDESEADEKALSASEIELLKKEFERMAGEDEEEESEEDGGEEGIPPLLLDPYSSDPDMPQLEIFSGEEGDTSASSKPAAASASYLRHNRIFKTSSTRCANKLRGVGARLSPRPQTPPNLTVAPPTLDNSSVDTPSPNHTSMSSTTLNSSHHSSAKSGDPNFMSEYYGNSRLHFLSTWGAEFKAYVTQLQSSSESSFPGRQRLREYIEDSVKLGIGDTIISQQLSGEQQGRPSRIIMHIDMDSFFVSVGLRDRPDLKGKAVAVTHSKGGGAKPREGTNLEYEKAQWRRSRLARGGAAMEDDEEGEEETARLQQLQKGMDKYSSMAEIASCSYEARKAGVRNGMFMGEAKKLCPTLVTIPYDFDKYRQVSQALYDTVASYTHDIEAVSCDEMYVDLTDLLADVGMTPISFAKVLRREIREKTNCNASAGLAGNILLARMATRKAKPNGQYHLTSDKAIAFMAKQLVKDLPGVGFSTERKLQSMGIKTCKDMQKLTLDKLQKEFGPKTGQSLFKFCRGEDDRPIKVECERKSVSAEINYGIRFANTDEAEKFVGELAQEVHNRLQKAEVKAKTITLKLKVRREGAPKETAKFMGHGICDNVAKSCTLPVHTDSAKVIAKECMGILKPLKIDPTDMRGVGIQMSRLESTSSREGPGRGLQSILNYTKHMDKQPEQHSAPRAAAAVKAPEVASERKQNGVRMLLPRGPGSSEGGGGRPKGVRMLLPKVPEASQNGERPKGVRMLLPKSSEGGGRKARVLLPKKRKGPIEELFNRQAAREAHDGDVPQLPNLPTTPAQSTDSNHSAPDYLPSPSQVDPQVLRELPEEIRRQIEKDMEQSRKNSSSAAAASTAASPPRPATVAPPSGGGGEGDNVLPGCSFWSQALEVQMSSSKKGEEGDAKEEEQTSEAAAIVALPSLSQVDPSCLAALPPDLQEELKVAYAQQDQARPRPRPADYPAEANEHPPVDDQHLNEQPSRVAEEVPLPDLEPSELRIPPPGDEATTEKPPSPKKKLKLQQAECFSPHKKSPHKHNTPSKKSPKGKKGSPVFKVPSNKPHSRKRKHSSKKLHFNKKVKVGDEGVHKDREDREILKVTSTLSNENHGASVTDTDTVKDSSTAPPPPPPPDAIVEEEEEEGEVAGQEEEKGEEDMSAEVNLCGAVSMEEVRSLVVEWLDSSQDPDDNDVTRFTNYIADLVRDKNLEQVDLVLKFFHRRVRKLGCASWTQTFEAVLRHTQQLVQAAYGAPLKVDFTS